MENEKNALLIEKMKKLNDEELVNQLWEENAEAWKYVYLRSVIPVLKSPKYYAIMNDRRFTPIDIYGMVYDRMLGKKKLAKYEFKCPVIHWIRYYVRGEVLYYCKKNPFSVSDNDNENPYIGKGGSEYQRKSEEKELARECFKKLWKESPMKAYVHLLKTRNEMSAKEIMRILGVSSESNVNQIFTRAINDICDFREELLKEISK